jgi:UrcA family protein
MKNPIPALLAAALLSPATHAAATEPAPHASRVVTVPATDSPAPAERVIFSASDLASASGTAKVEAAIHAAARQVCDRFDARDLQQVARFKQCYASAVDGAMQQLASRPSYVAANPVTGHGR